MSRELRNQQRELAAAVTGAAPAPGLLAATPQGAAPRIGVYRHAYTARLSAALRDNFEVLARALGDAGFDALAQAYIAARPSMLPSIRWFGHKLADFMADRVQADDGLVAHPALVDLARMDWALRNAFDGADAPQPGRDALAALPADAFAGLRFTPHPTLRLLPMTWAVEAAWRALHAHDPASGDDAPVPPEPQPNAHVLLVWRRGLDTRWRSLDAGEAALLHALVDGADFATLCEHAAAASGDADQAASIAAAALARWLDEGLLSAVT